MAEIKNGKITFTTEEQPLVDELINNRVNRELKKYQDLETKYNELLKDKDTINAELSKSLKDSENLQTQLKNAGIETDNLKSFVKNYQTQLQELANYKKIETLTKQKTAFIEAGGDATKFDKAVRLVEFKDGVDPKETFNELLKDDTWKILRATNTPDPNAGEKAGDNSSNEDEAQTISKGWADILFKKNKKQN